MNDFTVLSNEDAADLTALRTLYNNIVTRTVQNQVRGIDGLSLVEIRNMLDEIPVDVLNRLITQTRTARGTHEF